MRHRALASLVALLVCPALQITNLAHAEPQVTAWRHYIPERDRNLLGPGILARGRIRGSGDDKVDVTGLWLTDRGIKGVISRRIDDEHLSASEAQEAYEALKNTFDTDSRYIIIISGKDLAASPAPLVDKHHAGLRALNRSAIAKGSSLEMEPLGTYGLLGGNDAIVTFPKVAENGEPLIRFDHEVLELWLMNTRGNPVVIEFRVVEFVKSGHVRKGSEL